MIRNIQALRGIAILLVVAAHLTKIQEKYFSGFHVLPEFLSIGISGVDLFFVISGFVMVYVTRNQRHDSLGSLEFLAHRITRIYPLYWFYSLIVLMVFVVKPAWVNAAQGHQADILRSLLLVPLPQGQFPLLGVGWSLIHEMYFYAAFALLLLLPRIRIEFAMGLWVFLVVVVQVWLLPSEIATIQLIAHPLTLEFISGCLIAQVYLSGNGGLPRTALACGLLFWLVAYTVYSGAFGYGMAAVEWRRPLVFGIPAALVCYGLALLERDSSYVLPGWVVDVGNSSYSIYLSHLLVISALGRIWALFRIENALLNLAGLIGILIVAIVVGKASYRWLEKPALGFTRRHVLSRIGF
jgi:exopolysaccharide production protein ExoZ